jgi:hypothetical protein
MKTIVAALTLLSLAMGSTFAASSHTRHLQEGRDFYVPQSAYGPRSGYYGINGYSRLRLPTAPGEVNIPNPSGGIPGA